MCITENLSWRAHICSLCHSLSKMFLLLYLLKTFKAAMCFGTIILPTFTHDLDMALYSGGGGDKRKHKGIAYPKKGD